MQDFGGKNNHLLKGLLSLFLLLPTLFASIPENSSMEDLPEYIDNGEMILILNSDYSRVTSEGIQYSDPRAEIMNTLIKGNQIQVIDSYPAINALHVKIDNQSAQNLLSIGVVNKAERQKIFRPLLQTSNLLIRANETWVKTGFNGSGVSVCILDTGLDNYSTEIPRPIATNDFSNQDWCIDSRMSNPLNPQLSFNYSLNISNATLGNLEIGVRWFGTNRYDIRVFYPNNQLANSTAGLSSYTFAGSNFVSMNISINTTGSYTIEFNETAINQGNIYATILWGSNIASEFGNYTINSVNGDFGCTSYNGNTPVGKDPKAFVNNHTHDDASQLTHGTHVTGTIVRQGNILNTTYKGAAPGARIMIAKIFSNSAPSFQSGTTTTSDILNAMTWCVNNGANIVSMSIGGSAGSSCNDSEIMLVDSLTNNGTLFVIAAGNNGPNPRTINSPGCAKKALTVGATAISDVIAGFSSRGPTNDLLKSFKPEITGPGVNIISSIATNSLGLSSGTSMATPHVSGVAAILKQFNKTFTPAMLKVALINSANQSVSGLGNLSLDYGLGRVDAFTAVNQTYVTSINISNNTIENFTINLPTGIQNVKATIYWEENSSEQHNRIYLNMYMPFGQLATSSQNVNYTLQQVTNQSPASGNWRLTITGNNVFGSKKVYIATNRPLTRGNPVVIDYHGYAYTYFYLNNTASPLDGGPDIPLIKWTFNQSGLSFSYPILANGGYVYTGSNSSGNIYALNASNGSLIWNYSTGALVHHVSYSNGTLYASSENNNLYAINATNGTKIWNFSTGGPTFGPVRVDDIVYVASADRNLYAINATTGTKLWNFATNGMMSSSTAPPAIRRLGLNSHILYLSIFSLPGDLVASNETIALQTNITGFTRLWVNSNYSGFGDTKTQNILANDLLYRTHNLPGRQVEALNATNGSQVWVSTLADSNTEIAGMAFDGQRIIVATRTNSNGTIFLLNSLDGGFMVNFSVGSGIFSNRIVPASNDLLFLTAVYPNGSANITNIVAFSLNTGNVLWNLSREEAYPLAPFFSPPGGPFVLDGVLYTAPAVIAPNARQTLYAIEPIGIIIISPPNNTLFPIPPPILEAKFFMNGTSSSPQSCSLFIDGVMSLINPLIFPNVNITMAPSVNLSLGNHFMFIECVRPSGIRFSSDNIMFSISSDSQPPLINIMANTTHTNAGANVLINATAYENESNMSMFTLNVFDPTGTSAANCGTNTTNSTNVSIACIFSNSSGGGIYTVVATGIDGVGNVGMSNISLIFSNPTVVPSVGGNLANVTVLGFNQLKSNYSVSFPSVGGGNETNFSAGLRSSEILMPIFLDKPFFAGPTTFESLGYNYTVLINVSAGLPNGTLVNLTFRTGANIPARIESFTMRNIEGNRSATSFVPAMNGNFTIITNNIRGSSLNNSGAVSGRFGFPGRNDPFTQVNLTINASNSPTPYQINVTLIFPSKGPIYVVNQTYTGFDFRSPPPLGSVLTQSFHVDLNNSEPFFSPTNVFLEFMFPANATVFNSDGTPNSTIQSASNPEVYWFNFSSNGYENATGRLASYNITQITGCFNVTDNQGSALRGKNISTCMTGFRYNLGSANLSWTYGSRARLNVTASLNFSSLGETKSGGGIAGRVNSCGVTVNIPVEGSSVTIPDSCAPNTCSASSLNVTLNGVQLNSSQFRCGSIIITGAPLNLGPNDVEVSYFIPGASSGGVATGSSITQSISITDVEASCNSVNATIMPTTGVTTRLLYKSDSGFVELAKVPNGGKLFLTTNYSGAHQLDVSGAGYLPATRDITVPSCPASTTEIKVESEPESIPENKTATTPTLEPEQNETVSSPNQSEGSEQFQIESGIKEEILGMITSVQDESIKAKSEGKNTEKTEELLAQALAFHNAGDYSNARVKALEANRTLNEPTTILTTESNVNATQSQSAGNTSLLIPVIGIIGLVFVTAIAVYYLFLRRR